MRRYPDVMLLILISYRLQVLITHTEYLSFEALQEFLHGNCFGLFGVSRYSPINTPFWRAARTRPATRVAERAL